MIRVWRFALSRRWWAGHVLVLAGSGLFLALARWQWDRAHSVTGDWQNFGYALQWPLFAVFLSAAWLRFLWLEQHAPEQRARDRPRENRRRENWPRENWPRENWPRENWPRGNWPREVSDIPARVPAPADRPTPEDDPDDELTAYNAYLARLAEQDQRR